MTSLREIGRRVVRSRHRPVALVIAVSGAMRWVAQRAAPLTVFQDSLVYLDLAHETRGTWISPARPSGYPLVLRGVSAVVGDDLNWVTLLQHVAGLGITVLVYWVLFRLSGRRLLVLGGAAIVGVDGYAMALEHSILAESLFTAVVVVSLFLVTRAREAVWTIVASGVLLAAGILLRTGGLFVVPVWVGYLLLSRLSRRDLLVGAAALATPLLVYASAHAMAGSGFTITTSDGWFLYGRIAAIANCDGAPIPTETRTLCQSPGEQRFDPNGSVWFSGSPARRLFSDGIPPPSNSDYSRGMDAHSNGLLRRFALGIIIRHPASYLRVVATDFGGYFRGVRGVGPELVIYGESNPVLAIPRHFRLIRPIAGLALALAIAATALGAARRSIRGEWPEYGAIALLTAASLALLLGPVATTDLNVRYLVPVIPLVVPAGLLAAPRLWEYVMERTADTE